MASKPERDKLRGRCVLEQGCPIDCQGNGLWVTVSVGYCLPYPPGYLPTFIPPQRARNKPNQYPNSCICHTLSYILQGGKHTSPKPAWSVGTLLTQACYIDHHSGACVYGQSVGQPLGTTI